MQAPPNNPAVAPNLNHWSSQKLEALNTIRTYSGSWGLRPENMGYLEQALLTLELRDLDEAFSHDPWMYNFLLSIWEFARGKTHLTSYPWNITLPIADVCNARCEFCTSWLEARKSSKSRILIVSPKLFVVLTWLGLLAMGSQWRTPASKSFVIGLGNLSIRGPKATPSPTVIISTNGGAASKVAD